MDSTKLEQNNDREKHLKVFDESKAGVKGLVDSGIVKIPPFFVVPEALVSSIAASPLSTPTDLRIPIVDIKNIHENTIFRKSVIEQIQNAATTWGFFQLVNHGIPEDVMQDMICGVKRFHEQTKEEKVGYYSRDEEKKVRYNSNFDLYKSKAANWRDSLYLDMAPDAPDPEELPPACREIAIEYSVRVKEMGVTIFKLLSEALGLEPNHLFDIDCAKGHTIVCHYYPACPEPDRTLGGTPHKDPSFITILLQDHIGGLQVFHQNHWIDVTPVPGAFLVNIGDLLQLISNDKFKSAEHRVLANHKGPRISIAFFFTTHSSTFDRFYRPLKELVSDDSPALYREVQVMEYVAGYCSKGLDAYTSGSSALDQFRL